MVSKYSVTKDTVETCMGSALVKVMYGRHLYAIHNSLSILKETGFTYRAQRYKELVIIIQCMCTSHLDLTPHQPSITTSWNSTELN